MLLLNNEDVKKLLTAEACVDALERAYTDWAMGRAAQMPEEGRMDLGCSSSGPELDRRFTWGAMAGILPSEGIFALRQKFDIHFSLEHADGRSTVEKYCIEPDTYCGFVTVASTRTAEPLAIINDGYLQHLRVAGTSAVAAKNLARSDARVLAIIGSGGMASAHAATICAVRPIETIRVYSPTEANRKRFASETGKHLGVETIPVESPEIATKNADIVAFCTNTSSPVFPDFTWIEPGMHCTNIRGHEEVGDLAQHVDYTILHERGGIVRAWAESEEQYGSQSAQTVTSGIERSRKDLPTLSDLLAGRVKGRITDADVTYFHNRPGAGIQFAAIGAELIKRATESGTGTEIPTSWFLQDIRD